MARFNPYSTPRRSRISKHVFLRSRTTSLDNVDVAVNRAFRTALQNFISFDHQNISSQSFQEGISTSELLVSSGLYPGGSPQSFQGGVSTSETLASSGIYPGGSGDKDFNMSSPVGRVAILEENYATSESEVSSMNTSFCDVFTDNSPMHPRRCEELPAPTGSYCTEEYCWIQPDQHLVHGVLQDDPMIIEPENNRPDDSPETVPGHYEAIPRPSAVLIGAPLIMPNSFNRAMLFILSFLGVLLAVFAVTGAGLFWRPTADLKFLIARDTLTQPTVPIIAPSMVSDIVKLESSFLELVRMVQKIQIGDMEFISGVLDVIPDVSSRSSKLTHRIHEVSIEMNERISTARQLFVFSRGQNFFLRSTVNQMVEDAACDLEPKLAQLAQTRMEIQEVRLYLDYLQGALHYIRRLLIMSTEVNPPWRRVVSIGIGTALGFGDTVLRAAELLPLLDRVDAQKVKADLSLLSEAMVVMAQTEQIRGLQGHLAQVYPHPIQCFH